MRRTPSDLFSSLLANPTADFTQQEAQSFFDSYLGCFFDLGLLIPGSPRNWTQCLNCGQTHELTDIGGVYWLSCPDDGVGAEAINADQLKTTRFGLHQFYSWLQSQFSLRGSIEASDGRATLGQGMINGNKRLFIFSLDNSSQAREKLYQEHPANQAVIVYLNPALDSHKGYDINLAEYLVVQENRLSIDVSLALGVIEDMTQATSGDQFAFELVQGTDMVMMTGSILGGQSLPLFRSKKPAFYRILSTLLKVHQQSYDPTKQFSHPLETVANQHQGKKENELETTDIVKSRQLLNSPGKELMSLLLSKDYPAGKTVFTFRRAITQADYDGLTPTTKAKISSALSNSPEPVKG